MRTAEQANAERQGEGKAQEAKEGKVMNEGDAILRDIIDNPDNDGLRLIYADWLEDNGRGSRSEFIRVQIANPEDCQSCGMMTWPDCLSRLIGVESSDWWKWRGFKPPDWKRGFLHTIRCTMQAWLDHGKDICTMHPIERVEITDREPRASTACPGEFLWDEFGDSMPTAFVAPDDLPSVIWRFLTGGRVNREGGSNWHRYASKQDAIDALSCACLAYARQLTQSPTAKV